MAAIMTLTMTEAAELRAAAEFLMDNGICLVVPGWYELEDADDAVAYARDPEKWVAEAEGITVEMLRVRRGGRVVRP